MGKMVFMMFISAIISFGIQPSDASAQNKHQNSKSIKKIKKHYKNLLKSSSYVVANGKKAARQIKFLQPQDNVIDNYDNLQQIALIRHGEPDMLKSGKFSRNEAAEYIKCYDSVCIIVPDAPFFIFNKEEEIDVFSSPLNRALSTAQYLCGPERNIVVSSDFREFETSIKTKGHKMRLPIKFWTTTARLKWMLGIKKDGIESYSAAKKRAKRAAEQLSNSSKDNKKTVLFGHGMLNHYIKKDLKKMGWKVVADTGNDYFGTSILVKINNGE